MKTLILFIALVFNVPAFAGALPSYSPTPSGGTLSPGSFSNVGDAFRTWASNDAGDVFTSDRVRVAVGAANADMFANRRIPWSSVLGLGARALTGLGAAALLYDAYRGIRCLPDGMQFLCDLGLAGVTASSGWVHSGSTTVYATAEAACRAMILRNPGYTYKYVTGEYCVGNSPTGVETIMGFVSRASCPSGGCVGATYTCPGGAPADLDNRCAGGAMQSLSPDDVAAKIAPYADSFKPKAVDITKQAIGAGHDAAPYTQPQTATGPSSITQPQTQVVTKTATGTTQISTITTTNNITYQGDTYNITNVTTKKNPDGSEETTTEQQKDLSQCAKSPNSLACVDLGTPSTESPTWQTKNVVYQADALGLPAGCPAPWTGQVHGWNLSMSWQPACDQAPAIRAGVLALAGLTALMLIITTLRQ